MRLKLNLLLPAAALFAVSLSLATSAHAASITGTGAVSGGDSFTSNSITFNPTTGIFFLGTGSMAAFNGSAATLTGFSTASAVGTTVFSATSGANVLAFTITQLLSTVYNGATPSLTFTGNGTFNETGYTSTPGSFSLATSTSSAGVSSITSFTLNGAAAPAVTPEPSSLLLLGTGLIGAATTALRRRKISA